MNAQMLAKFVQKYGKEGMDLIAKHPGKSAAVAGLGAAAAGIGGAKMGSDATINAIPREILKKLGLDESMVDNTKEAYTDAMEYAKKHPIAGGMIGAAAYKGVDPMLQKIMAMLGASDEQRQA